MNYKILYSRVHRILWFLLAMMMRPFIPIRKKRIIMWSFSYQKYTCHPQHFSEYLLRNMPGKYEIIWAFEHPDKYSMPSDIIKVKYPSIKYIYYLYSSHFIISNSRTKTYYNYFRRKKNQEYILMWHDCGIALKKIELDAAESLGRYVNDAINDSKNCTLMISASDFQTKLIKKSFWYDGEILKCGLPRNDCFVGSDKEYIRSKICQIYHIPESSKIVLYAPTFRNNEQLNDKVFIDKWDSIIESLNQAYVLVRLHPNSLGIVDIDNLCSHPHVVNFTDYNDMQELLISSDYLITDYSSCMFDFAILRKPCILYATDIDSYDRGYYFDLRELPFLLTTDYKELGLAFKKIDICKYNKKINDFLRFEINLYPIGEACASIESWINNKL